MNPTQENIQRLNNSWLNVNITEQYVINPFERLRTDDPEEFYKRLTCLLLNPDYFCFICKHILNIDLLPMQALILREMWNRKFPMLVGSRGLGKLLRPNEKIRVKNGWKTMEDLRVGDRVYGSNGKLCDVVFKTDLQKDVKMYRLGLCDGREIDCCEDHLWKVWDKTTELWLEIKTKDIQENRYAIPINQPLIEEEERNLYLHPYVFGVLLGAGVVSHDTITVVFKDKSLIEKFIPLLPYNCRFAQLGRSVLLDSKIWSHSLNEKLIPSDYKFASYSQKLELIKGLMDARSSDCPRDEFRSESEGLIADFLEVIRSLGFYCKKTYRDVIQVDADHPKSKAFIKNVRQIENGEGYCITVNSPDSTYITKDYIVTHNTFMLSLYCILRAVLIPNRKIVVVGAAFRQSKYLHDHMENIWRNAPILRDMCDTNSGPRRDVDMCKMTLNGSVISALPIGDGQKIRGQRANDIVADEFASMSREIFENVIAGFVAVSASPVENVKRLAREEMARELGIDLSSIDPKRDVEANKSNQIILSGTAYYDFNHFAEYWKRWKTIIETRGDLRAISNNVFNGDPVPSSFKWDDYSIIRIPVDLVPKGFMDDGQIARSKATIHNGIYLMEFGAVFTKDSQGFFKRSLIESCVGTDIKPVKTLKGEVFFDPALKGNSSHKYIMAVDPASEVDNFSIVVLELHEDHRRIVYCWTTTRKDHTERVKKGLTEENNFYSYCARKIRELMDLFPVVHISMDAQGGGYSVSEALHGSNQLLPGERPIWPIKEEDKPKPSDDEQGLHILEMCQFARYDWYSDANHGLRKDLEDKTLIFPRFDPVTIGLSIEEDKMNNRLYDTLEDCVMEIEELKNELSLIEVSESVNGRQRWDTPEVKIGIGKKKQMRKDRYSSLLMANMAARNITFNEKQVTYSGYGGFASSDNSRRHSSEDVTFSGPSWFTSQMNNLY